MKIKGIALSIGIASSLLLSCKESPDRYVPARWNPAKAEGSDLKKDPNLNRDPDSQDLNIDVIREKILQPLGGSEDDSCVGKNLLGKRQLRLLTIVEYQNTVKDILKISKDFSSSLPHDAIDQGFPNAELSIVSDAHASAYLEAAINIANEVKPKLPDLVACDKNSGLECAQKVIDVLGPQLWRRPLEASEKVTLINLYKGGLAVSVDEAMTLLLSGLLTAPDFLYRSETGKGGTLTPYELASALSYFFWGSAPDSILRDLAAKGELPKEAVLLAQAQRLLANPRSKYLTSGFAQGWIQSRAITGDDKNDSEFPKLTDKIKNAMAAEAEDTFDFLMRQNSSTFEALFNSEFTVGTAELAAYYKGQSKTEDGVSKITFPGTPRKGVLGLGATMAHLATPTETHPVMRGNFVLERLLCSAPPPTPSGLSVALPEFNDSMTTRQRFAAHTADPRCSGCHLRIDGIGFGLEDFDGAGLYRTLDKGLKVNTSGEIIGIDGVTTKFSGVEGLSSYLATSTQAKRCFVIGWYRYASGHSERSEDICSIREIANRLEKGSTLAEILLKMIVQPAFIRKE